MVASIFTAMKTNSSPLILLPPHLRPLNRPNLISFKKRKNTMD